MTDVYNEQITTQAPGQVSGGRAPTELLRELDKTAAELEGMAQKLYSTHLKSDYHSQLNDAYNKNIDNPKGFDAAVKSIRKGIGVIPDAKVAVDFLADFDIKASAFGSRVITNQIATQRKATRDSIDIDMTTARENAILMGSGMFGDFDDDALVGYRHAEQSYLDAANNQALTKAEKKSAMMQWDNAKLTMFRSAAESMDDADRIGFMKSVKDGSANFAGQPINKFFNSESILKINQIADGYLGKDGNYNQFAMQDVADKVKAFTAKDADPTLDEMMEAMDSWRVLQSENAISDKRLNGSVIKIAPAMLEKFEKYRDKGGWFHTDDMLQVAMKSADAKMVGSGVNPYQKLDIYAGIYNMYSGIDKSEFDKMSRKEQLALANRVAADSVELFAGKRYPGFDSGKADAVITPGGVLNVSSNKAPAQSMRGRYVQDDKGNTYEQYPDENGQYSEKSVKRQISSGAKQ